MRPSDLSTSHTTTRKARVVQVAVSLVCPFVFGAAAAAQSEGPIFLRFNESLTTEAIEFTGFKNNTVDWTDAIRRPRTTPFTEVAAMVRLPIGAEGPTQRAQLARAWSSNWAEWGAPFGARGGEAWPTESVPVIIDLVDRQRVVGELLAPEADGEIVRVRSRVFRDLSIPIDTIARLVVIPVNTIGQTTPELSTPAPLEEIAGNDDIITLNNGDRVTGFVLSMGREVIIDAAGQEVTLPINRIKSVRIAAEDEPAPRSMIWLPDGSRVAVAREDQSSDAGLAIAAPGAIDSKQNVTITAVQDRIVALSGGAVSAIGLSSIEPESWTIDESRRWGQAPVMGPSDLEPLFASWVHMPGLMETEWRLPPEADRLRSRVRLGDPSGTAISAGALPWASCTLVIEIETIGLEGRSEITELARYDLDAESAASPINLELPGRTLNARTLRMKLIDRAHGPIQDRVTLDRPLLLLVE